MEKKFLWTCACALPPAALLTLWVRGTFGAAAFVLTCSLAIADYLWLARGVRAILSPGRDVPRGIYRRALAASMGRTLLLLIGLYVILRILPEEGPSAAAGILAPLVLLAVASLFSR